MCPACLAAAAWAVAGTTSAGGLTAFVVRKLRHRKPRGAPVPAKNAHEERKRP